MNFKKFLIDNLSLIAVFLLSTILTIVTISMDVIKVNKYIRGSSVIYAFILSIIIILVFLVFKYIKKKQTYDALSKIKELHDASYISAIPIGKSGEETLYKESLETIYASYENNLSDYKRRESLHRDFNNLWIHQMKTPISVINLLIENGLESKKDLISLKEELDKLDNGLELALYNLRLQDFKTDFKVEKVNLVEVIRKVINDNKNAFILNSVYPKLDIEHDIIVSTDRKWIEFIFNQIIQNSIKYTKIKDISKRELNIGSSIKNEDIELYFHDNGIGICNRDLNRLFQPFFTGENGRKHEESTGMGLYLSNIIIDRLGHRIRIESKEKEFTRVTISFVKEKSIYNI